MDPQTYSWTCSVCTFTWCIQSTGIDPSLDRQDAGAIIGYPGCVNETYGLMNSQCLIDAFGQYNLVARELWTSYDEAYAVASKYTGGISPSGMYHWMAIRGVSGSDIWVANSARGYRGVYDTLSRAQYNNLGPTKLIYLESYAS